MKKRILITASVLVAALVACGVMYGVNHHKRQSPVNPRLTSSVNGTGGHEGPTTPPPSSPPTKITMPPVDGIACQSMEGTGMHIHAHLDIFRNGQHVIVPAGLGIHGDNTNDVCFYWLHTHDDSGVIHEESPTKRTFTLGEFFDIAGTHRYDHPDKVFVNGKLYTGDVRNVVLGDHYEIVLEFGPKFVPAPKNYDFPAGLQ